MDEGSVIRRYLARIGAKGGKSRSAKMTPEARKRAAKNAANKRWKR